MLKNKYIKLFVSAFLLLMLAWVATPKVYLHQLLNHDHSGNVISTETKVKSQSTDDCDFEKYDKPVYFSIFKFIFSFIPSKAKDPDKVAERALKLSNFSYAVSLLRAAPVSE